MDYTLEAPTRGELRHVFACMTGGDTLRITHYPRHRVNNWVRYYGLKASVRKDGEAFVVACRDVVKRVPLKIQADDLRERLDALAVGGGLEVEEAKLERLAQALCVFTQNRVKDFDLQPTEGGGLLAVRTK
jgi:hypothetical protein